MEASKYLINGWYDVDMWKQIIQHFDGKVRNPDGSDQPFLLKAFQGSPSRQQIVVSSCCVKIFSFERKGGSLPQFKRPMQKKEVQIVQLQLPVHPGHNQVGILGTSDVQLTAATALSYRTRALTQATRSALVGHPLVHSLTCQASR